MHRAVVVVVSALVVVTSCSSGDDPSASEPAATEPATESGPSSSEPASTDSGSSPDPTSADAGDAGDAGDPTDAAAAASGSSEAVGGTVAAELDEWVVEAPTEYDAGPVTFEVSNTGTFTHEFVVIRGDSYETLPLAANGTVIEEDLADGALVGRTPRIGSGGSETLTVDLEPGGYVLLCNIAAGPSSHAAQGQRLAVSVG